MKVISQRAAMLCAVSILAASSAAFADSVVAPPTATPIPSAAPAAQDVVAAHEFRVVDKDGKQAVVMNNGANGNEPTVCLYDKDGHQRILIHLVDGTTPQITILRPDGKSALTLSTEADGKNPQLTMYDSKGATRSMVAVTNDSPIFALYQPDGNPGVGITVEGNVADIALYRNGKRALLLGATPGAGSGLGIFDDNGKPRLVAGLEATGNIAIMGIYAGDKRSGMSLMAGPGAEFLSLQDPNGVVRTRLQMTGTNTPVLTFKDGKSRTILTLPEGAK
jgi:hypothetical protein